jgi:hypothetical protein
MPRPSSLALCLAGLAGFALIGCSSSTLDTADADRAPLLTHDAGAPEPYVAYPLCEPGVADDCAPMEDGHRGTYSFGLRDVAGGCFHACNCVRRCGDLRDCPLPESGNTQVDCIADTCILRCDGDLRCPTGMACAYDSARRMPMCMWVTEIACTAPPTGPPDTLP